MENKIKWSVINDEEAGMEELEAELLKIWSQRKSGVHLGRNSFFSDVMTRYENDKKDPKKRAILTPKQIVWLVRLARDYYKDHQALCAIATEFPSEDLKVYRATLVCAGLLTKKQREDLRQLKLQAEVMQTAATSECNLDPLE